MDLEVQNFLKTWRRALEIVEGNQVGLPTRKLSERGKKGCLDLDSSDRQALGWIHQGHSQVLLAGVEATEPLGDAMLERVLQRRRIVGKSVAYRWVLRWT